MTRQEIDNLKREVEYWFEIAFIDLFEKDLVRTDIEFRSFYFNSARIRTFNILKGDWESFMNRRIIGSGIYNHLRSSRNAITGNFNYSFTIDVKLNNGVDDELLFCAVDRLKLVFRQEPLLSNYIFKIAKVRYPNTTYRGFNFYKFSIILLNREIYD
jgi:hypothetical protein